MGNTFFLEASEEGFDDRDLLVEVSVSVEIGRDLLPSTQMIEDVLFNRLNLGADGNEIPTFFSSEITTSEDVVDDVFPSFIIFLTKLAPDGGSLRRLSMAGLS